MPELPDVCAYLDALRRTVGGRAIERVQVASPFLLRTFEPAVEETHGRRVVDLRRIGKRIVFGLEGELFLALHLMVAGRLRWTKPGARPRGKIELAAVVFEHGTLLITEASQHRRASLHVVRGEAALAAHDRGGLEVLDASPDAFAARIRAENHTLRRTLTDPRLFSGIGNAYADEILHAARLSPVQLSGRLSNEELARLFDATRATLEHWVEVLRARFAKRFPGPRDITAFRPEFAVHGRFGLPCPVCGTAVQRIRWAENETNYCPRCQTGGRVLADRSLSRLLRDDWPRTVEALEEPP